MDELAKHLRPPKRSRLLVWGVIAISVAISFGAAQQLYSTNQQTLTSATALAGIRAAEARRQQDPSPKEQEDIRKWGAINQERAFDWALVFESVESTINPNIGLLEFTPDKLSGSLQIKGQARSQEALSKYIYALSKVKTLRHIHLVREYSTGEDNAQIVNFEIFISTLNLPKSHDQSARK